MAPIHSFRHQFIHLRFSHPQHGLRASILRLPQFMLWLFIVNHPVKYIFRIHTQQQQRKRTLIIYGLAFKSQRTSTFKSACSKKFTCWRGISLETNFPIGDQCSHAAECIHSLIASRAKNYNIISLALRCW